MVIIDLMIVISTKRMSFFNKVDFCITKSKKSGNGKKLMHFDIGGKN